MTVLEAVDVVRHYPLGRKVLRAVDGVSFQLAAGRTLAVVGESGCGKSTLARLSALMEPPTAGTIRVAGQPAEGPARRTLQLQNQMVFQNPYASLNPRRTIGEALIEPLTINRRGSRPERATGRKADARPCGPTPRGIRTLSAPVLRRAAPARRDCPRVDAAPRGGDGGRAGLGARRFGAGAGAEPDARPAGRAGHRLSCSSATTSRSCGTWRRTCWSCMPAARRNRGMRMRC